MTDFMVEVYAEKFTADELNEMRDFYRTDVGRKALRVMPQIMRQTMSWTGRRIQAHAGELRQTIREAERDRRQSEDTATE